MKGRLDIKVSEILKAKIKHHTLLLMNDLTFSRVEKWNKADIKSINFGFSLGFLFPLSANESSYSLQNCPRREIFFNLIWMQ